MSACLRHTIVCVVLTLLVVSVSANTDEVSDLYVQYITDQLLPETIEKFGSCSEFFSTAIARRCPFLDPSRHCIVQFCDELVPANQLVLTQPWIESACTLFLHKSCNGSQLLPEPPDRKLVPCSGPSPIFAEDAPPHMARFMTWLCGQGFVHLASLRARRLSERSGYGVFSTRRILNRTELFVVPKSASLFSNSQYLSEPSKRLRQLVQRIATNELWNVVNGDVSSNSLISLQFFELAAIIFLENRTATSHWRDYFDSLSFPSCPLFYAPRDLEELQNPFIERSRFKYHETILTFFRRFMAHAEFAALFGSPRVPYDGRHLSYALENRTLDVPALEREFLIATSILLQRSYSWDEAVIIPFMDLLNYAPDSHHRILHSPHLANGRSDINEPLVSPALTSMGLVLNYDVPPGENELYLSYGKSISAPRLLLQYGFALPDFENVHEGVHLFVDIDPDSHANRMISEWMTRLNLTVSCIMEESAIIPARCLKAIILRLITSTKGVPATATATALRATCIKHSIAGAQPLQSFDHPDCRALAYASIGWKLEQYLAAHPTTIEQDVAILAQLQAAESSTSAVEYSKDRHTAVLFRLAVKRSLTRMLKNVRRVPTEAHESDTVPTEGGLVNWPVGELVWEP